MPSLVSPGVSVSEIDATTVAQAVATTVGGIAGVFRWGPVSLPTLISDEPGLVRTFGKPTNLNPETFFSAANFLGYSNQLYVTRIGEQGNANASLNIISAYSNSGAVSVSPAVKNADDYSTTTLDANVVFVAKYPGEMGNSLKISQCDSVNAFSQTLGFTGATVTASALTLSVGSNTAQVAVTANAVGGANTSANTFLANLTVGDYLVLGNTSIGTQTLKISSVGTATEAANGGNYTALANIGFTSALNLSANVTTSAPVRNWEYGYLFDRAPGTSSYMTNLGLTAKDEVHIVVIDEDGWFSGTPGTILESWKALSRATDAKTDAGATNYYKTVLNSSSQYIWWGHDRSGAVSNTANNIVTSSNVKPYVASLINGQDGNGEGTVSFGKIAAGYDFYRDKDTYDVSLIIQGKARGASADSDTVPSSNSVTYSGLATYLLGNLAEERKDLMVAVSPAKADVVLASDPLTSVLAYRNNITIASDKGVMESGYKYQYDKYNDMNRWIPLNGDIAGTIARTENDRDAWFSPAGTARGQIKNVIKLAWNPNQAQRDALYKSDVNPVVSMKGQGTILYGDKTLIGRSSAFDRINVRRLFITLEKAIAAAAKNTLFEFNDYFTRNAFVNLVEPFLRDVQARRGIYDYRVVCDETNNTQQVIDSNRFVGSIFIKPARSINFIELVFTAVRSGVEFSTIIGTN